MNSFNFKTWLISENKKNIFGFDNFIKKDKANSEIIDNVNPDIIINQLLKMNLGNKIPKSNFNNEIIWSNETNDKLKLEISPYGSLRATIKKIIHNSEGEETWITKHVYLLPDENKNINELDHAFKIFEKIKNINNSDTDSNNKKVNFESICLKTAESIKLKNPSKWMIFYKIKKITESHYVIILNMTGSGLEISSGSGPSNKIEQYQVNMTYNKNSGIIRCFGNAIESSKKHSQWYLGIPDWDENFITSQKTEEITECIVNSLKSF